MAKTTLAENSKRTATRRRGPGRPFIPGQTGNAGGRPKKDRQLTAVLETVVDKQELGEKLWKLVLSGDTDAIKLAAIKYIYDRIDGTPPQRVQVEISDAREEAERIADDLGLEGDERQRAVAETVRLLAEARE